MTGVPDIIKNVLTGAAGLQNPACRKKGVDSRSDGVSEVTCPSGPGGGEVYRCGHMVGKATVSLNLIFTTVGT